MGIERCKTREKGTQGHFNWLDVEANAQDGRADVAEYMGPIEIFKAGRSDGRWGVKAARDIQRGELLVRLIYY